MVNILKNPRNETKMNSIRARTSGFESSARRCSQIKTNVNCQFKSSLQFLCRTSALGKTFYRRNYSRKLHVGKSVSILPSLGTG